MIEVVRWLASGLWSALRIERVERIVRSVARRGGWWSGRGSCWPRRRASRAWRSLRGWGARSWRWRSGAGAIERGMKGLRDTPRSGGPLTHGAGDQSVVDREGVHPPTADRVRAARRERWTTEELGEEVGISASQAHVILSRAEIKPHRTEYWVMTDYSTGRSSRSAERGLRPVPRSPGERAGALDRCEDEDPGEGPGAARTHSPAGQARAPGAITSTPKRHHEPVRRLRVHER